MSMAFRPRPGFRFATSAANVGGRIEQLKEINGGEITPEAVVEDARPEGSPLHDEFGELWDDAVCGVRLRTQHAQTLIGSYLVVREEQDDGPREVLGNVRVVKETEMPGGEVGRQRVYVSPSVALADPNYREQVFHGADRYLAGAQERLRLLRDAEREIAEIERIRTRLRKRAKAKAGRVAAAARP
jgi:hypothetical protein